MKIEVLICLLLGVISGSNATFEYLWDYGMAIPDVIQIGIDQMLNTLGVVLNTKDNLSIVESVHFYIASRDKPTLQKIDFNDNLEELGYDLSLPSCFWTHGYIDNGRSSWIQEAAEATLSTTNGIFFAIDWKYNANFLYLVSASKTKPVGSYVGEFITRLIETQKLNVEIACCVGHSLGSHVCGFAGKKILELTGKRIGKIYGLDPAGPAFWGLGPGLTAPPEYRLSKADADSVIIVHTDPGFFGTNGNIGTCDLWLTNCAYIQVKPYIQSKCLADGILLMHHVCSHRRAHEFFIHTFLYKTTFRQCKNAPLTLLGCTPFLKPNTIEISGYNTVCTGIYQGGVTGKNKNETLQLQSC